VIGGVYAGGATVSVAGTVSGLSVGGGALGNETGSLELLSGGVADGVIDRIGTFTIDAGAVAIATLLPPSVGSDYVYGVAIGTTIEGYDSPIEYVGSGGVTSGTIVNGEGTEQVVLSGGVAKGTIVQGQPATQLVYSGGIANGTVINPSCQEVIYAGGVGSGLVLANPYGNASASLQFPNDKDYGLTIGTVIDGGQVDLVESLGVADGSIVNSGGVQEVASSGVVSGTVVSSGHHLGRDRPQRRRSCVRCSTFEWRDFHLGAGDVHDRAGRGYPLQRGPSVPGQRLASVRDRRFQRPVPVGRRGDDGV
jgi:autotransporter passenger strand-loop-strand repeat protein